MPEPLEYATPVKRRSSAWTAILIAANLLMVALIFGPLLIPSMTGPRPASNRIKCSSNLRQIGLAIKMYANDNNGVYPPDFRAVLLNEEMTADVFDCPSTADTRATGPTTQRIAELLIDPAGHHCSYFYAGDGLNKKTIDPDAVVAFEPLANHDNDGTNILFGDDHVEWIANGPEYTHLLDDYVAGIRPLKLRP